MEERRASSPPPRRKATTGEWLLAFPEQRPRTSRRPPSRAEKVFNAISVAILVLFAVGWSWSIARARAAGDSGPVTPASADRKSTRLNSSHTVISYAVFCLKKKNTVVVRVSQPTSQGKAAGQLGCWFDTT